MTASFEPTEEQLGVIRSDAPRIVVSAGAGTGKTATLAARYVRLVRDGCSPRQILCVTFTRKAAAEMKIRIVSSLVAEGMDIAAQEAETGPIQTMHSFYERVLRENAIAAGLDPGLRLAEDDEREEALRRAVRETLLEESPNPKRNELARLLLASEAWQPREDARAVSVARKLIEAWAQAGLSPEEVRALLPASAWPSVENRVILDSQEPEFRAALLEEGARTDLLAALRAVSAAFPKGKIGNSARGLAAALEDEVAATRRRTLAAAASEWATETWERLLAEEERTSVYSFASLERLAVRIVRENPSVAARLRRRFRHIMVDESQDLNPLRHAFLAAMNPDHLLQVGDGQQSIFLFQGADRDGFLCAQNGGDGVPPAETHELTLNRRSRPQLLDFVGHVFAERWKDGFLRMSPHRVEGAGSPDPDDPFKTVAAPPRVYSVARADETGTIAAIETLLSEGFAPNEIGVLVARYDAGLLKALDAARLPYRLTGGNRRLWLKRESRDLANALDALADSNERFALLAMLRSPIGGLSLAGTLALARREGPLLAPDVEFEDARDEEAWRRFRGWFDPLSSLADHLPAWEVLARVVADSPFLPNLGREEGRDQAIANVRMHLVDATRRPAEGLADLARRLRIAKRTRATRPEATIHEEGAPLIAVSTVHAAKGLEWNAVVLHHASTKFPTIKDDLYVEPRGVAFGLILNGERNPLAESLRNAQQRREIEEHERLDYVAATRARDVLVLVTGGERRILSDGLGRMPISAVRRIP